LRIGVLHLEVVGPFAEIMINHLDDDRHVFGVLSRGLGAVRGFCSVSGFFTMLQQKEHQRDSSRRVNAKSNCRKASTNKATTNEKSPEIVAGSEIIFSA